MTARKSREIYADQRELVRCYVRLEMTYAECGRRFGVSASKVAAVLKAAGVTPRPAGPRPRKELNALPVAYRAEITPEEAARLYGCHENTVLRRARKAGVAVRPQQRPRGKLDTKALVRACEVEKLSLQRCGERFGISDSAARLRLIEAGVTMRPSGRLR